MAVFILVCLSLWIPGKHHVPVYETKLQAPQPAGEITAPFRLRQLVHNSSDVTIAATGKTCVGLRFATYRHEMEGQFTVALQQASFARRWVVEARSVVDNQYKYFCTARDFRPGEDFSIAIEGMDGKTGSAATVWLTTDTTLGHAVVNGRVLERGLNIIMAREILMTPRKLIRLDHGAFLIGWLCTLLTGLAVLFLFWRIGSPETTVGEGTPCRD
jgi:hypothetical protein